ncbi:MAG: hypothetical protein OXN17_11890 [Candidatus Poribacteria bacterium]|nr:hypothetical protein [Candidatus Poribacteria bacterium]
MKLLFSEWEIQYYASRYPREYDAAIESLVPEVKKRGYLTGSELMELTSWQAPGRKKGRVLSNLCD